MKKEEKVNFDITYQGVIKKIAELFRDREICESLLHSEEAMIDDMVTYLEQFYSLSEICEDIAAAYKEL